MLKSAYEIAMEKSGSGKTEPLTAKQKAALAEIDSRFDAQLAEKEILFEGRMRASGAGEESDLLRAELASERQSLNARREKEKEKVRANR